jgi:uncharacterized SAM-binding protein YcdF (DUF218 family)
MLAMALLAYVVSFIAVVVVSRRDGRRHAHVIAVLGAAQYNGRPSPVFRARLDHAAALYKAGLAPVVVVMGGKAEGDRESEAAVGQRYLRDHGVPRRAALAVPEGRNTEASIIALADWMGPRALDSVLLVSDPFHLLRLELEARRHGLVAATSPTTTSPISRRWRHELPFLAAEALKLPVALARSVIH